MSDETTLLPCPWCGEYPKIAEDGGGTGPWFCVWHDCPPVEGGKARHYGESFGCISITTAWFHTEAEAIAAWNTRAHGTLTSEQVREAIERNFGKVAVIDDGGEKVEWREGWVCNVGFNSQAIADELNAELGSGTCEWPTDVEGQRIQIADTIHMLRTEYDGDHEWEDVVIELVYVEHGGDKWIVRGARGEAWACECTVTGHDDELYDNSGDWSNLPTPWDRPEPDGWYKCPNLSCGCVVGYSLLADDSRTIYMDDYQIPFNHCPQCGKVVCE